MPLLPRAALRVRAPAVSRSIPINGCIKRWIVRLCLLTAMVIVVLKLAVGGFLLALIETVSAKMRIFRAPEFLGTAFLLAVLAMLVHLLLEAGT